MTWVGGSSESITAILASGAAWQAAGMSGQKTHPKPSVATIPMKDGSWGTVCRNPSKDKEPMTKGEGIGFWIGKLLARVPERIMHIMVIVACGRYLGWW
jgi:hypothetical protein